MPPTTPPTDAQLKEAILFFGTLMNLLSSVSQGVSLSELGQLIAVGQTLPPVIKDASLLWPQYKALTPALQADLDAYVSTNVSFPASQPVQAVTQTILDAVISLSSLLSVFGA